MNTDWQSFLRVALGGALGSMLRFGLLRLWPVIPGLSIPVTTFLINIIGCFGAGFLYSWMPQAWRESGLQLWSIGFLGGFTTFSAFGLENARLIEENHLFSFIVYSILSILLGILSAWLGLKMGRI